AAAPALHGHVQPRDRPALGEVLQDDLRLGPHDRRDVVRQRHEGVGAARRRQAGALRQGGGDGVREESHRQVQVLSARRPRIVVHKATSFPCRSVARNIALGLEYRGGAGPERARRVREAVALAGLEGFEEAFPATLSGGMRQRVALMRTLVVDPEILLMDEPFGALDTHTKLVLHAELLALWEARRQTVVLVTHDLSEAITLAARLGVLPARPGRR